MNNRNWEVGYYADAMKRASTARYARGQELTAAGHKGDPLKDHEYCRLRLTEEVIRTQYITANALKIAYATRDRNHRTLGKQYGLASRTIRALKGEIALLRTKAGITELGKTMAEKDMMI